MSEAGVSPLQELESFSVEESFWADWDTKGRANFFEAVKKIISNVDTSGDLLLNPDGLVNTLPMWIYSFLKQRVYGQLTHLQAIEGCARLVKMHPDIPSALVDALNVLEAELSVENNPNNRTKFIELCCGLEDGCCSGLIKERMEMEVLNEFKIINKFYYSKFIKMKTKLYYKQNKFNMYREENEGYAKLIILLNQDSYSTVDPFEFVNNIKALIGCFSLDPARVIDVIFDTFQDNCYEPFFLDLLKNYMSEKSLMTEVLGFRLSMYREHGNTPQELMVITASLVAAEIVSLDHIYDWLYPDAQKLAEELTLVKGEAAAEGKKSLIVSIKKQEEPKEEKSMMPFEENQKVALCAVTLRIGHLETFEKLVANLGLKYVISYSEVCLAGCQLLHYLLDYLYRKHCNLGDKITNNFPPPMTKLQFAPTQPKTFLEMRDIAFPLMYAFGSSLSYDSRLVFKICRIFVVALQASSSLKESEIDNQSVYYDGISILEQCLLPSLSCMEYNCCAAESVWSVVKLYPLEVRYCIYTRWKDYQLRNQEYLTKKMKCKINMKSCLKKVSKENVKQIGRQIGKVSHYLPIALFDYILMQIQMYDNLIVPVVDSLRFMTNLGYDVLGFCIYDYLMNIARDKPRHDGSLISPWFTRIATFWSVILKKCNMDISGVIFYLLKQLKANQSIELMVLKELMTKMTGIEVTDNLNPNQIEALTGGELLKSEGGTFFQQPRYFKKTALRLKDCLIENHLVVPFFVMAAKQKYKVIFEDTDNSHLKFLGKLYDECHDILLQIGVFLGHSIMHSIYETFPSISQLMTEYMIPIDIAFYYGRPMLHYSCVTTLELGSVKKDDPQYYELYAELFFDALSPVAETVKSMYNTIEDISPRFLVLFWALNLSDILVPFAAYTKEITKQKEASGQKTSDGQRSSKRDSKACSIAEVLADEGKGQEQRVLTLLGLLKKDRGSWFPSNKLTKNEAITLFLQLCIFPRCLFSVMDALYCAKFIHTLHLIQTPNFMTLLCYDRIFIDITFTVASLSENEANRYGAFLCAVIADVMRWHSSKEIYDKECVNSPGFVTKFRVSNEFSAPTEKIHYENFRHVCHKWHYKIAKSLLSLLESDVYVQIRNGILVLIKILPQFPVISKLGNHIDKKITKVREAEKNKRQDLYTLATSYNGQLLARSSNWIKESDFHHVSHEKPSAPSNESESMYNGMSSPCENRSLSDYNLEENASIDLVNDDESKKSDDKEGGSTKEKSRSNRNREERRSASQESKKSEDDGHTEGLETEAQTGSDQEDSRSEIGDSTDNEKSEESEVEEQSADERSEEEDDASVEVSDNDDSAVEIEQEFSEEEVKKSKKDELEPGEVGVEDSDSEERRRRDVRESKKERGSESRPDRKGGERERDRKHDREKRYGRSKRDVEVIELEKDSHDEDFLSKKRKCSGRREESHYDYGYTAEGGNSGDEWGARYRTSRREGSTESVKGSGVPKKRKEEDKGKSGRSASSHADKKEKSKSKGRKASSGRDKEQRRERKRRERRSKSHDPVKRRKEVGSGGKVSSSKSSYSGHGSTSLDGTKKKRYLKEKRPSSRSRSRSHDRKKRSVS